MTQDQLWYALLTWNGPRTVTLDARRLDCESSVSATVIAGSEGVTFRLGPLDTPWIAGPDDVWNLLDRAAFVALRLDPSGLPSMHSAAVAFRAGVAAATSRRVIPSPV